MHTRSKLSRILFCLVFYGFIAGLIFMDYNSRTINGTDDNVAVISLKDDYSAKTSDTDKGIKTDEYTFSPTSSGKNTRSNVEALLESMTTEEKVYQMFIVYPEALSGTHTITKAGSSTRDGLSRYPVGGIVYTTQNLQSSAQTIRMIAKTQSYSKIPLLIAADEEGGEITRLMERLGTEQVSDMYSYRNDGVQTAYNNAGIISEYMLRHGFNTDFAPVADVWSNPENKVIGSRAYSDNYDTAAELVPAAVRGFREYGLISTLKHFPGHGSTWQDSHDGASYVDKDIDQLKNEDLKPFISGIKAGADMVMTGHLTVPAVDSLPATISYELTTNLLRNTLGFEGVVITDALKMGALDDYSSGELAVMAVNAGADILLGPDDLEDSVRHILDAVENGTVSAERIDESVHRILSMKDAHGLLPSRPLQ